MGRTRRKRPDPFSPLEIEQMEEFLGAKIEADDKDFCVRLTERINLSSGRVGKKALQWKQVQRWLQCKQKDNAKRTVSFDIVAKELLSTPKISMPNGHEKLQGEVPPRMIELEARSSRDGAWYDVDEVLSHRVLDSGELEALVRYKDFGPDEDEWLNVKKAVRQRSVPVESNECHNVAVGDLVICFREGDEKACYFEACVMDIQRKLHDVRGCRCRFLLQYTHDQTQETVRLPRICRRP